MKKYIPKVTVVSVSIFLISWAVYFLCIKATYIADLVNSTVSVATRYLLAQPTNLLPFSLFELIIVLSPILLIFAVVFLIVRNSDKRSRIRSVFILFGIISLIMTSYIFTLGIGYHTTTVSEKIGVEDRRDITTDELYRTVNIVIDEINAITPSLTLIDGETVMPYSIDDMNGKLISAFDSFNDQYGIIKNFHSRVKPVYFSEVMSDLQIAGIYSFFTGEANVNVEYPDYCLPFTAAHELAHQRGVCRENEANFIAFLVCISSDDEYIRYSGYLGLYEYLASALYNADSELYKNVRARISEVAVYDMIASNEVYNKHKDSMLGKINDRLNDAYLKANGTDGVVSYGYVVRLAVGYYRKEN